MGLVAAPVIVVGAGLFARSIVVAASVTAALSTGCWLGRATVLDRRRRRIRDDTISAVKALGRELSAGGDLAVAVDGVAAVAGPAAQPLLQRLDGAVRFGAEPGQLLGVDPLERSLQAAIWMSRQYGIPLAAMVFRLADGMEDQVEAAQQRATAVAGATLSGYLLAGLPLVGILLGAGMGANPIPVLLGGGTGSTLLLAGVSLTCAGLLWSARIAR